MKSSFGTVVRTNRRARSADRRLATEAFKNTPFILTKKDVDVIRKWQQEAEDVYRDLLDRNAFEKQEKRTIGGQRLTPGDVIYRPISVGKHFGVYIGKGKVVEVEADNTGLKRSIRAVAPKLFLKFGNKSYVRLTDLSDFRLAPSSKGNPMKMFGIDEMDGTERRSRQETVRRAINAIGPWNYKLTSSNCEHFATGAACRIKSRSKQIEAKIPNNLLRRLLDGTPDNNLTPLWSTFKLGNKASKSCNEQTDSCPAYITMKCKSLLNPNLRQSHCYSVSELASQIEKAEAQGLEYSGVCGILNSYQVRRVKDAAKALRGCRLRP